MAGKIPKQFIDDLLARIDIIDLIERRVPLKKAGKDYQACCPFHNEKTPSFTVSSTKQFYHCFGCGANGNAISFLMDYDKLEFVDAIEELASMLNLQVPREKGQGDDQRTFAQKQSDYELMQHTARFYQHQLKHHKNSTQIIAYIKGRGLSGETVKRFSIGYAPVEWAHLYKQFGQTPGQKQQLLDLKLITEKQPGRPFDFFRDRLMFPIKDKRGRVIAFGGRTLASAQDKGPKYLNSPETRIFYKSAELYGLYEAKQANKQLSRILIVEGYMDVVALAEHGINYAVASLGTSTTAEQMQVLFRHTDTVICCYDGDRAGKDAAWRALTHALPVLNDGKSLQFVFLPEGEDPDSLVQKEKQEAFEHRLAQAKPFDQVLFEKLAAQIDLTQQAGKAKLKKEALPLIEQLPSEYYRENLLEMLGRLIGRTTAQLKQSLTQPKKASTKRQQRLKITPMRRAIALLLQHPSLANNVAYHPELSDIAIPGIDLFLNLQAICLERPNYTTAQLLESFREQPIYPALQKLAVWQHNIDPQALAKEFQQTFSFIEDQCLHQRLESLLIKDKTSGLTQTERQECALLTAALSSRRSSQN